MITTDVLKRSFWALPVGEVLDVLETTREGLNEEEIKERQALLRKNVLPRGPRLSRLEIFVRQFKSPLLLLLLIAAAITLFLQDYKDAGVIIAVVMANVALGFYQENKAESALAHLKTYVRERTRVFRNGQELEIDAEDLVPGDIVRLAQGDRIPADCRVIYANDFMVDEAILTGESLPVTKNIDPVSFKDVLADRKSMAFSGTLVVQGFANAVVCATGHYTELGRIAEFVMATEKENTPLQNAIAHFSVKTSLILIVLTLVVFGLGLYSGKPLFDMFLIAVAIAVAAVPEGLPVALTVILAIGVQRLAKKNGVVRKLLAAETLGNTTVILTDKTGTLTQAKMDLAQIRIFAENLKQERLLKLALLNTDVVIENPRDDYADWRIIGRPLEVALVLAAARSDIALASVRRAFDVLDYLPFTSSNKFSASLIQDGDDRFVNVFGAPEILLNKSDLPSAEKKKILQEVEAMAYSGERVLGLATRAIKGTKEVSLREKGAFEKLSFLGTISFRDPVRLGVREAIGIVSEAGVRTVIVTGDHRGTAEAVAKEVGLHAGPDSVIEGQVLDNLSDEELAARLPNLKIVARVSPEGKVRIAQAFKRIGEVVAMTGDGINDAASLKEADIGVAMGSGTDVAKDVSDLILLDDNFATIVTAIEEGRRILENIRKVIVYLFSSLFDEILLIGGAIIFGLSLPLTAIQILFVNFVADTFPALALAFEDHIDHLMHKRKKTPINLFDKEMAFLTTMIGIPTSALLFGIYYYLHSQGLDPKLVQTFIFAAFSSYSLFVIFSVRSLRKPIFRYSPFSNPLLSVGVLIGLGLIAAAIYWAPAQVLLGTVALPLNWLGGVVMVGLVNIVAIELGKWLLRKWKMNGK